MKLLTLAVLDRFIPRLIKESRQNEELDRARAFICLLLVCITITALSIVGYHLSAGLQDFYRNYMVQVLYGAMAAFALAMGWFWRFGGFLVSGNLFGLTSYVTILLTANMLAEERFLPTLTLLMALPLLMAQTVGYRSGLFWFALITATPSFLGWFGFHSFEPMWASSWIVTSGGLFFSIYIGHSYRENMAERLRNERAHFEFAASHDALTGLANRITFDRRFQRCLDDCQRQNQGAVLVYIDLNGFKPINDSFGHHAGDQVLMAVADRLSGLVRRTDIVARLGGDEFAILFENCCLAEVDHLIKRIALDVKKPIEIDGRDVSVSCSMGVVSCPESGTDTERLYLIADQRMYEAKRAMGNGAAIP